MEVGEGGVPHGGHDELGMGYTEQISSGQVSKCRGGRVGRSQAGEMMGR